MHFDARLLAKFLKKTAMYRGVKYVESELNEIISNDTDGAISKVTTKRGDTLNCDFVFDCTGFAREIIGKHYNTPWESYSDSLPMNRAIPFFFPNEGDDIPPYTEAIAMEYGWIWKIPVNGRFGCGYVFDSNFIDDEQAKTEIKKRFGDDIEFGNPFTFSAGRYEKTWVKNCIAIGLSAGFIEPLEATSIWTSLTSLDEYLNNNLGAIKKDDYYINRYNKRVNSFHDDTKDFIYLHYLTRRDDSEFWKNFRKNNKPTENISKFLEECKLTIPDRPFIHSINKSYATTSFYPVAYGVGVINSQIAHELYDATNSDVRRESYFEFTNSFITNMLLNLSTLQPHSEFLKYLK
jgi:tryptophan halogenase